MRKLSNFLKNNGLNALSKAVKGNPVGAVASLFGVTGEKTEEGILKVLEVNSEVLSQVKENELEFAKLILEDRKSARRMQADFNNSEQTSWLTRNVTAIIALLWIGFCLYLYWVSLRGAIGEDQQMNVTVVSSITNITMLIVGFYFGSSEKGGQLF